MTDPTAMFAKMVPGFDFLQGLVKGAGAGIPAVGQWVAPTLDPEEIEKRISELKTVQFWLEQNARMLGATIQALEVQRMTLSTLKTMNVSFGDLTESLKIRLPEAGAFAPPPTAEPPAPAPAPRPAAKPAARTPADEAEAEAAPAVPAGVVDPMQWWGALTKQFTELASTAMKEGSATDLVKQSMDVAGETFKKAASMPMAVAKSAATAAKAAATGKPAPTKKAPAKKAAARRR